MLDKEWLKITRIRLHLTCEDIAKEMLCTKQTISNIENGKSTQLMTMAFYERILNDHLKETPLRDIFTH
jgi:DNA-binding XRE family transcriptional regulator